MKRMVKNGDLLDISENGSNATFGGNLKVGGTIIANGEIRGGDVSASKFYLGTEEMPLVKANPTGEATETLEKVKIGNVAYNVGGGGGGGSNDREITLTMPYSSDDSTTNKKAYIDDEIYNKIKNYYYESIKLYFNDGKPIGIFNVFNFNDVGSLVVNTKEYVSLSVTWPANPTLEWYGKVYVYRSFAQINASSDEKGKYIRISQFEKQQIPALIKENFDNLYKLADKPTNDGTYVLKATVSGGAVTYTWVAEA